MAIAGLMGLSGILIAAAGAHLGGGDLARLSADFLLIHAAVILALCGPSDGRTLASRLFLGSAGLVAAGTCLFSADLALAGLADRHPFAAAAPIGGLCLALGWFGIVVAALVKWRSRI
jgi:uncharacterized membrane protein YgdD (TMEM256/DUF423 family)